MKIYILEHRKNENTHILGYFETIALADEYRLKFVFHEGFEITEFVGGKMMRVSTPLGFEYLITIREIEVKQHAAPARSFDNAAFKIWKGKQNFYT